MLKILGKIIMGIFFTLFAIVGIFLVLCGGTYIIFGIGSIAIGEELLAMIMYLIMGLPIFIMGILILKGLFSNSKKQGEKKESEEIFVTEKDLSKK